MHSVTTYSVV